MSGSCFGDVVPAMCWICTLCWAGAANAQRQATGRVACNVVSHPTSYDSIYIDPADHHPHILEDKSTAFYPPPDDMPPGVLVYSLRADPRRQPQFYRIMYRGAAFPQDDVIFRPFGPPSKQSGNPVYALHVSVVAGQDNLEQEVSPTGRYVLLRFGDKDSERGESDQLLVWDLLHKRVVCRYHNRLLYWPQTEWSADETYLSFLLGGNRSGTILTLMDAGQLDRDFVVGMLNIRTGKGSTVAERVLPYLTGDGPRSLLYVRGQNPKLDIDDEHVDVYEYRLDSTLSEAKAGAVTPLFSDAYARRLDAMESAPALAPSPDGKEVAVFGWPDAAEVADARSKTAAAGNDRTTPKPGLYLYDRATNSRVRLQDGSKGILAWTHDGKILRLSIDNEEGNEALSNPALFAERIAQLQLIDPMTHTADTIADLKTGEGRGAGGLPNMFRILCVTPDSDYAIVLHRYIRGSWIFAVNLRTSKVTLIADVVGSESVSWYEGSLQTQ